MAEQTGDTALSTRSLPRPDEWTCRDRGVWFKPGLAFGVFGVLLAFAVALRSAVGGAVIGVVAFALLASAVALPLPRRLRVRLGEVRLPDAVLRGARFPLRGQRPAVIAWGILAVLFLACVVILVITAVTGDNPRNLVGTGVLGLFGFVFTYAVIAYLRRDRTNPPSITLSSDGLVLVANAARRIRWEEITDISPSMQHLGYGLWAPRQNAITIAVAGSAPVRWRSFAGSLTGTGDAVVRNVQLDSDPVVALHALRFYWQHPETRAELATEDAVARIRAGRLHTAG